jgi:hypothetical protein
LDLILPELPEVPEVTDQVLPDHAPGVRPSRKPPFQTGPYLNELSHLSARAKDLIRLGHAGAGNPYKSRSEADFAVCLAMFSAGYDEGQVRAVLTDPANGISEKYQEKGRYGESYLSVTVREARMKARGPVVRRWPLAGRYRRKQSGKF